MAKHLFLFVAGIFLSISSQAEFSEKIQAVVKTSSCAAYSWKNRGRAPAGYVKGVALSYARSLCRAKNFSSSGVAKIMSLAETGIDRKDALTHYKNVLSLLGLQTNRAGDENLRNVYTLGLGLGMRESSGKYCEGWDTSAGTHRVSNEAEAGLFQVSSNSMAASSELKKLYSEYQNSPSRCLLSIYSEGVKCKSQAELGVGDGVLFQKFSKSCPAFATEYAMTLLRILRSHFGPINRLEAEVKPICESLLVQVQQIVDSDPAAACTELR